VDADEKSAIESAIADIEKAVAGDDKAEIEAKTQALMTASQKLGEKIYSAQQEGAAAAGPEKPADETVQGRGDDVVDVDFREAKRDSRPPGPPTRRPRAGGRTTWRASGVARRRSPTHSKGREDDRMAWKGQWPSVTFTTYWVCRGTRPPMT